MLLHRISGEKTTKLPTLMSEYSTHLLNPMPIPPYQNAIENMNWIRKREYEERVREIEHGFFSPLVFSTAGGMGPIATVYKRIASLIADKRQEPYSTTLFWLRCKLSFSLLRSAIMCLRGTRSFHSHSQHHSIIALACVQRQSSLNNLLFASLVFII